jgi:hypothetical protein
MKLGTLSGCTHVNILGRSLGIFFRQFFVSWVLLLQLLHHLSDVFNQHSALSSAFKTIPIEILLCQHILPHTGSLPTIVFALSSWLCITLLNSVKVICFSLCTTTVANMSLNTINNVSLIASSVFCNAVANSIYKAMVLEAVDRVIAKI